MKKIISLFIVVLMMLTVVACGRGEADAAEPAPVQYEPVVAEPADVSNDPDPACSNCVEAAEDVCSNAADQVEAVSSDLTSERTEVVGVLTNPDQTFEGIIVSINTGWDSEREEIVWLPKMLDADTSFQVFELLANMAATLVPHPTHIESMQADNQYRIEIHYTQGGMDVIYDMWGSAMFFRFTDTVGSCNDPGFVMGENRDLVDLLEQVFQGQTHVVLEGDTLFSISRFYGVTVEDVQNANGLGDSTNIRIGETLFIPRAAH